MKTHFLLPLLLWPALGLFGQSCVVTSPTASQLIQTTSAIKLTATTSSAPAGYKMVWYVDYQRWAEQFSKPDPAQPNDFPTAWQGPFTVTWYPGLNGDGSHTVSANLYDIFGTLLATCPTVTFTVRLEGMSNLSINHLPTSGTAQFGVLTKTPGGHFMLDGLDGNASSTYADPLFHFCGLDGGTTQTGGWQFPNLVTSCWPNGQHLIVAGANPLVAVDPILVTETFTSGNVSGNQITVANHPFQDGGPIICTGTCPTPLIAGAQFFWATSATNPSNTVTVSIAAGTGTFTCSSACGVSIGTPVYIKQIQYTDQTTGAATCDGLYSAASGSGSSFTVTMPSVCNGALGTKNLEVDVNPSFVQYVDANTVTLAATPGGSTITLTGSGSGTMTLSQRAASPYWTINGNFGTMGADYVQSGGPANVYQLVTFANGSTPMQLHPNFWEMHLVAGAGSTALCTAASLIQNTDLTFTSTACTVPTWTEVDDGGQAGVCSVDSSGNVTPIMAGWCKVTVVCTACATGGVTLPTVTVYVQVHSGSVTFPHYTRAGPIATTYTPGQSFYPISVWQLATNLASNTPAWVGPALNHANVNSILAAFTATNNLMNPTATSCPSWPDPVTSASAAFASLYNLTIEYDAYSVWFNVGNNSASLAAILNNTGYDRHACLQSFISYLAGLGRVWRIFNDDEVSNIVGNFLEPNPAIGGANWTNATTSGGVVTFNVANITTLHPFSQTTGAGNAIQITGATTNSCLNNWFLITSVSSTVLTAPAGACGNGLTINSSSDAGAQMNLPFPGLANTGTTLLQNAGPLPANLSQTTQPWDTNLTSIVVASGVGTIHWTGHGVTSQAIRLYCYACTHNLLNFIGVPVVTDANTLTITWTGTAGGTAPADGTYNVSTDPTGFYITVDPNWGPNPLGQLYSLVTGVAGHPIRAWSMLGTLFSTPESVIAYQGNPANTDSSWLYVPQGPTNYTGADISVNQVVSYSYSTSGIASRAYQLAPRSMLFYGGYVGGGNMIQYCRSFVFNPGCDRPGNNGLNWRHETVVAQMMGMKMIGVRGLRLYNGLQDTPDAYTHLGLGWSPNNGGFGTGAGMSPYTGPTTWSGMSHTNPLLKMREDTELQPEGNKPYLGPYFQTDVHLSATYGNETTVLCTSEQPYGVITVPLNPIAGGSTLLYTTDGYTTRVTAIAGNPSSITQEWCPSPGFTWVYVSQPPGRNVLDPYPFSPPSPLPFGASKFLIQVGYYPEAMQDDPVTDCTSGCTIPIDHHNIDAWYRTIYADSNNQPLSISDPTRVAAPQVVQHFVTLAWNWSQGAGDPASYFLIERGTVSGGPYATIAAVGVGTTTFSDYDVSSGTYYYVVQALDAIDNVSLSPASNEAHATVPG